LEGDLLETRSTQRLFPSIRGLQDLLRDASGGLLPGCVLEIVEPLDELGTAIRHPLIHDVAVDDAKLLPDSHLDIVPQPDGRTRGQIWHFSHGFSPFVSLVSLW
jgi:hypothetical protein